MRRFSRRDFLKLTALTSAAAFTACQPAEPPEASALNLHNWPTYVNPDTLTGFSATTNILIHATEFGSNEELHDHLISNSAGAYDIVVPSDYMVRQLVQEKLLRPLDLSLLPNFSNIQESFRTGRKHDPKSEYSIAKNWGTTGIIWNPEVFTEPITSWADFWAQAPLHSGKITVVEARDEVLGAALKLLGYSLNDQDLQHLDEAGKKLMEIRPHLTARTDYFDMFADKTVVMGLGWNGDAFIISNEKKAPVRYTIPSEGSLLWEDDWCIPANAAHPKNAHAFINYLLQPNIAAQEASFIGYATVVSDALPLLDASLRNDPTLYPPTEIMRKLEQNEPPTADSLKKREDIWAAFLAG